MATTRRPGTARTTADGTPRAPGGTAAPWVRTRLRASAGGALALGLLVAVTAFLAAAVPRQVEAHENGALRHALAGTPPDQRGVTVTADVLPGAAPGTDRVPVPSPAELRAAVRVLRDAARPPLALDRDETVAGIRTSTPVPVSGRGLSRPSGLDPHLTLLTQPLAEDEHVRLVSGRPPSPDVRDDTVEAVVTTRTAEVMNLTVGSTVRFPDVTGRRMTVRVSGLVAPRDRDAAHWRAQPDLLEPSLRTVSDQVPPPRYWHFSALIDSGARAVLPRCDGGAVAFWHHPVRTGALTAADVPALRSALASLTTGPDAVRVRDRSPVADPEVAADGLVVLLDAFDGERRTARSLVLIAAVGVGAAAAVVLVMAGALAAAGRRAELALLRARGGSLPGIGLRLLGETAAVAVPAAAVGTACALWWVPAPRSAASLALGAAAAVPACLTLPVLAAAAHRRPRPPVRDDVAAARPSRRRTVVELTVVALAVGGLVALRRRGTAEADPLTAAVPVLLAVVAALVLLRAYPLPLRLLARPAVRLRGVVVPLALARLGRAPSVSVLPLLAVLVALTVTSFGGSVLAGAAAARARAAVVEVGADARVEAATTLPGGLEERIRRVAGVSDTTAVRREEGRILSGVASRPFTLLAVEPRSYARLADRTGLDGGAPFPAAALDRAPGGGPLPAVVSPGLAEELGDGTVLVEADRGPARIRAVAVRGETPAVPGEFAVVSADALTAAARAERGGDTSRPTVLLVSGSGLDGRALTAEARGAAEDLTVTLRSRTEAGYGAGPLQDGTRRVYGAAVAAGAGYGALALLLPLLGSAPERRTVLARLRTLGLGRGQGRALVGAETLPPVALGVLGGAGTALAAVSLLRPGVDLTPLAFTAQARASGGQAVRAVLTPDAGALVWPPLALLALACGVVAVQAWLSGARDVRDEGNRLRTGERE